MKEKENNTNKDNTTSFEEDEKKLLKKYIEEYNDMYQKILILTPNDFIEKLIKHVELSLRSKINKFSQKTRDKIQKFITEKIYESDYNYAQIIQKNILKRNRYELSKNIFKGEIIPHCDKDKKTGFYIHSCGERFQTFKYKISYDYYIMNSDKNNKAKDINTNHYDIILFCKKCKMIYKSSLIKFRCAETSTDFYSKIILNNCEDDDDLPFATWSKYHCNVVINDLMKCHNCSNNLYLLKKKIKNNEKIFIFCKKCNEIWTSNQLRWECLICKKKFCCEAKAYNPLEFKTLKICVKDAIVDKIRATPQYLDCKCKIDFSKTIFFHRTSCNGELFFGELNGKKTVICNKCDSIGFYDGYVWTCPICHRKTKNIIRENKFDEDIDINKAQFDNKSAIHSRDKHKNDNIKNDDNKDSISASRVSKNGGGSYRNRRYNLYKNNNNNKIKEDKDIKEESNLKNSISTNNYLKSNNILYKEKENNDSVEKRKINYNLKNSEKKEYKPPFFEKEKEEKEEKEDKDENEENDENDEKEEIKSYRKKYNIHLNKKFNFSRNPKEEYFRNSKKKYVTNISINKALKTSINENDNNDNNNENENKFENSLPKKEKTHFGKLFSNNRISKITNNNNINNSEKKADNNNNTNNNNNNNEENKILKTKKSLSIIDFDYSNIKGMKHLLTKFEKKININLNLNLQAPGMNFHRPVTKRINKPYYSTLEIKDKEILVSKNKTTINDDTNKEESQISNKNEGFGENIKRKNSFMTEFNKFKKTANMSRISSSKAIIDRSNTNTSRNKNNINNSKNKSSFVNSNKENYKTELSKKDIKKDENISYFKRSKIFQRYKNLNNNESKSTNNRIKIKNEYNKTELNSNNYEESNNNNEEENNINDKEQKIDYDNSENYNNKKGSNSTAAESDNTTKIIYHSRKPKQSFRLHRSIKNKNNFDINDYKIIKKIGQGSFGQIFQIEDKYNNRYAMKKILVNSENDIKKIEHEYQILIDLNLEKERPLNLVKIYGYYSNQLDPTTYVIYVLMELAITDWEKEILSRQKTKKYYSEKELMIILSTLINTFAELQKKNISHRDIKPQNILLFKDNKYKLADFGEAKQLFQDIAPTNKQTLRGTELYMAPALFNALQSKKIIKYINHNPYKSDVFSFGLCSLFAATLCFESIYDVRELNNNVSIHVILEKYLRKNYSFDVINAISHMLDINETTRKDFIEMQDEFKSIGYE